MIVDLLIAFSLIAAIIKGWRKGLILSLFSVIALIVALAAAMKLSVVIAEKFGGDSSKYLPVLSFLIIFILIALLIRLIAKIIEKAVDLAMLGWLNKLGGIALYSFIYLAVLSIILFYLKEAAIISENAFKASNFYLYIEPLGPAVMNSLGNLFPVFKNMFTELQEYFSHLGTKI